MLSRMFLSAGALRAQPACRMFLSAGAVRAQGGLTPLVTCCWLLLLPSVRSLAATLAAPAAPLGEAAESLELALAVFPRELRSDRSCLLIAAWRAADIRVYVYLVTPLAIPRLMLRTTNFID